MYLQLPPRTLREQQEESHTSGQVPGRVQVLTLGGRLGIVRRVGRVRRFGMVRRLLIKIMMVLYMAMMVTIMIVTGKIPGPRRHLA